MCLITFWTPCFCQRGSPLPLHESNFGPQRCHSWTSLPAFRSSPFWMDFHQQKQSSFQCPALRCNGFLFGGENWENSKNSHVWEIPMFGGEKFGGAKIHYEFSYMEFPQWISVLDGKNPPQKKKLGKFKKIHWNSILGEGGFPVRNLLFQALISRCEGRKVMVFLWKDDIFFLKLKVVCCICCWFKKNAVSNQCERWY